MMLKAEAARFTKREIIDLCPNMSASTVERNLRAMVVCSEREIAYELSRIFEDKDPEWFVEKKMSDKFSTPCRKFFTRTAFCPGEFVYWVL